MNFKTNIKIFMVCALFAIGIENSINAQTENLPATVFLQEDEIQEILWRYRSEVEEIQQYLSDIVNTNLTNSQRLESISAALDLFIGKGKSYYVKEESGEITYRNPVRIQISNIDNTKRRWMPLTTFLQRIYDNRNQFGSLELTTPPLSSINPCLIKVDDDLYKTRGKVEQTMTFYKDGKITYGPGMTTKEVEVFLKPNETPSGFIWYIKLGDIYATSTETRF